MMTHIDDEALDGLSVAPAGDDVENQSARPDKHDSGQDKSIAKRLQKNPASSDAQLDNSLDESMDASDPPSSTQPAHDHGPAPSSGYDAAAEKALADRKD